MFLEAKNCQKSDVCVVMVEKPIVVLPFVWTFAPNALPQPLQNLTLKLDIDGFYGVQIPCGQFLGCKKKTQLEDQHGLVDIAVNLTRFY
jgi:hypothetical protein